MADLFTLPVRLGLRGARMALRTGVGSAERAVDLALSGIQAVLPGSGPSADQGGQPSAAEPRGGGDRSAGRGGQDEEQARRNGAGADAEAQAPPRDPRSQADPSSLATELRAPEPDTRSPEGEAARPEEDEFASEAATPTGGLSLDGPDAEPAHVSEEATFVESFAEPGAEDGAGAEITVEEPWDGYAGMKAPEVIARASGASEVELAAAQLYERAHRKRASVLSELDRALEKRSHQAGPRPPDNEE